MMIITGKEVGGEWGGRTGGGEERRKIKGRKKCEVATYLKDLSLCQELFRCFSDNPSNTQVKY